MPLKTIFISEDRSKSHLWRYEVFVRSLIKTKGHGYINLTTKVSIVRGDPVPGCLLHLTVRVNTTALCTWLLALPDTTTQCSHRVSSSVTTGYRTNRTFLPDRGHYCMSPSLQSATQCFEHPSSLKCRAVSLLYTDVGCNVVVDPSLSSLINEPYKILSPIAEGLK